jgi:hypothetical protein
LSNSTLPPVKMSTFKLSTSKQTSLMHRQLL